MEEEDTRELLLPNWQGSGTMGLTLDQTEEGVFVKQLVQNSPAAKTGKVREGDQIVGATVYFDNMSSEDIEKLLANVGQHTVGLKLQRKGDRSPQPGVTYSHDVFSLKSPDVVLSGDDEDYRRIYTKKIKPRLKSDETLEPETQTRTITVTRKVTAYTVDVTGSKDSKEIDISSPEYKIKIPRHEITEISKTSVETEEGKTMIRIPGIDVSGKSLQTSGEYSVSMPGDSLNVHTTTVRYKGQSGAQFEFPEGENDSQVSRQASVGMHVPDISASGPKFQSYEKKIDVKMSRFGAEHDIGFRGPKFASEDIGFEVKAPDYDTSTKSAVNIKASQGTTSVTSKIGFQSSSTTVKGSQLDIKKPEGLKSGSVTTSVRMPETDINISSTQSQFINMTGDIQTPKIDLHRQDQSGRSVEIVLPGEDIKMPKFGSVGPKVDSQFKLCSTAGAHVDITPGFEGKANTSKVNLTGPTVDLKGTDIELENSVGKITIPSFKVPKFGFSETNEESAQSDLQLKGATLTAGKSETWGVNVPKISMPNVSIDTKGSTRRVETGISGIELEHDLKLGIKRPEVNIASKDVGVKGSKVSIEGQQGDVADIEGRLKMPKFNLPKFGVSESKLEGGIGLSDPKDDIEGAIRVKDPNLDIRTPALDITSQFGKIEGGHLAKPFVSVPKISEPDMDLTLKGPKGIDITKPKVNITGPTVDMNVGGKVEGLKFKVPPVQLPQSETHLKGPAIEGNLEGLTDSIKVPDVDFVAPKIDLGAPEGKLSMPKFKMPKFGISESNLEGPHVDVNLPKLDVIDAKMDVDGSKLNTQSVNVSLSNVSVPKTDLSLKGPKVDGELKAPTFDIKGPKVDLRAPDLDGKIKGSNFTVQLPNMSTPDVDLNLKGPEIKSDFKRPGVDLKGPQLETEGKLKMPTFKMPKFGISKTDVEGPDIDPSLPTGKFDIAGPKVNIESDIRGPKSTNVKLQKVSVPEIDVKGPKFEGDLTGLKVDIKTPEVGFQAPDLHLNEKIKSPKLEMPSVNLPEMSMPDTNLSIKGAKLKDDLQGPKIPSVQLPTMSMPDADLSLKGPKLDVDFQGSKLGMKVPEANIKAPELDLELPDVSLKDTEGKLKMPKFKMPKFGVSKLEGPNLDVSLPAGKIDISGPKVDIEVPESKVKGPKFNMQTVDVSLPPVPVPDGDLNLKGPKLEGGLKGPTVELGAPDLDFDGKVKGSKFKLPSIPKMPMPDVDLNLKGPKLKGDLKGEFKGPDLDVKAPEVDAPDISLKGAEGKLRMPKFKMPKIGLSGSKVEGNLKGPEIDINTEEVELSSPNADLEGKGKIKAPTFHMPKFGFSGFKTEGSEVKLPKGDIELSGPQVDTVISVPKIEGEVKGLDANVEIPEMDVQGPDGKVKGPKFKMPSMNINKPKISMPNVDFNLKGSKWKGGADISGPKLEGPDVDLNLKDRGPKIEGDLKPEVDLDTPDFEVEGKVKGSKFKMPSMNLPDVSMPHIDLKGPHWKGGAKGSLPKVEGELEGPNVNINVPAVDIGGSDLEIECPEGKLKMPKIKMPKFGLSGPNVECPEVDISLPKTDIDLSGPDADIETPEVKVKGSKIKMPSMNFNLPKMSKPDVDLSMKGPKIEEDLKGPNVDIKAPEVDFKASDVEIDGKVKGPKFKVPSVNFPKMHMPDVDLNMRGPNWKGGADISLPRAEGEVEGLKVDLKGPEFDVENPEGKVKIPKLKMPKFGFSGTSVESTGLDVNIPKADFQVTGPELDVDAPDINVKGSKFKMPSMNFNLPKISKPDLSIKGPKIEGDVKVPEVDIMPPEVDLECPAVNLDDKVKGPKFNMPSINLPKMPTPNFDINLKGPKVQGDVKAPKVDIKMPEADLECPDVDLDAKVKGPQFTMPSVNLPKVRMPDFDLHMKGTKLEGDVKAPKADIKIPEADLVCPDVNLDAKVKGPKFKMPSVNVQNIALPDVDLNLKGPNWKGKTDYTLPKVEGELKGPEFHIGMPDVDSSEGKIKMPKFKMPKFGFSGPSAEGTGDINLPTADLEVSGPDIEIDDADGKIKGPKFKMPSINLPTMSKPHVDLNIKGPKWKSGEADISTPNLEVDLKGPVVDVKAPEVDIEGPEGKLKAPKMKMPSLDIHMPKISMPDLDLNLKGPKLKAGADIEGENADINLPKLEGDFKCADVDLEVPSGNLEGPEGKLKMPKFKMPRFGFSGPSAEGSSVDVDLSGPKVNVKTPEVGVEIPEGKVKGPKIKIPSVNLNLPHVSMPDIDLNVKGPKLKGGIDGPDTKIEADIKDPKIEIKGPELEVPSPSLSAELPEGKVKGSKFKLPSWGFSKPNVSMPDVDLNLKGPKVKGDLDVTAKGGSLKGPELGVGLPEVDIDVPEAKVKKSKFRLPKFNFSGSKSASVDIKVPKTDFDVSGPEVDIPNLEAKGKSPKFKMPSLNITSPKVAVPDVELNLKGPKFDGEMPKIEGDLKGPNMDIKGPELDVEGPNIELETPDVDLKGPEGKFKMPKFKMPKFSMSGPKVEGGLDVDASLPKGDFDVSVPDVNIKAPEIDIECPEGKVKGPHFKMPSLNINAPKVSMPEFDLNMKGPKVKGDLKVPKGGIKGPEVDFETPEFDTDGKVKGPKFKLPSMPHPKISMPDVDLSLKTPKFEGGVKGPNMDIKGPELDVEGPNIELETPDVDLKGPEGKFKMPKFKMPKFSMSGPKVEGGLDVDASLPKGDFDVSVPDVNIKAPEIDIECPEGKVKGPHFKMPSLNINAPKVSMPEFDLNLKSPKVESDLKVPKGGIKGPEVEIETPELDVDGKIKGSKFKMPSLNLPDVSMPEVSLKGPRMKGSGDLSGPKLEGDLNLKAPNLKGDLDVTLPKLEGELKSPGIDVDLDIPEGNLKAPKVKKPKFGFGIKSPKAEVKAPSVDVAVPEVDFDSDLPEVSLSGKGKRGKFKMPKIHMSGPKIKGKKGGFDVSAPDIDNDINLNAPDVDLNVSGGDAGIGLKAPKTRKPLFGKIHFPDVEFDIKSPKLKGDGSLQSPKADLKTPDLHIGGGVKMPETDLTASGEGPDIKMKKTKFKLPGFSMSGPKVEVPNADLSLSKGTVDLSGPKIDMPTPNVDVKIGTSINSELPNLSVDTSAPKISVPGIDVNLQGPKVKADKVGSVYVDVNPPSINISESSGKINVPEFGISGSSTGGSDVHFDTKFKTPKLDASLQGPSITTPAANISFPKVSGSDFDMSFKGPKVEGDFGSSGEVDLPGINVKGIDTQVGLSGPQLQGPHVKLPKGEFSLTRPEAEVSGKAGVSGLNIKGPSFQTSSGSKFSSSGITVSGQGVDLKGGLSSGTGYFKGPDGLRIEGTKVEGDLTVPKVEGELNVKPLDMNLEGSAGKITFPRLLMPKFTTSGPELSGREVGVDVDFPSADVQLAKSGQANVDLGESDIKIKKSKIKMPKLNFKSKGKVDTSLPEVSVSGSKGDLQSSKASLGTAEGGLGSATLEVEKPAKYEFSLFTSKKTRHRSSSLSEEKDESTHSSPSGTLEAEGSLSVEGAKKKGKHSKIKFGTFGGLGSKSKGSYEVTLDDDENVQGSGASLSSRKSRVSSSSSNDSATKAGVRLPKVELTVAKKKE